MTLLAIFLLALGSTGKMTTMTFSVLLPLGLVALALASLAQGPANPTPTDLPPASIPSELILPDERGCSWSNLPAPTGVEISLSADVYTIGRAVWFEWSAKPPGAGLEGIVTSSVVEYTLPFWPTAFEGTWEPGTVYVGGLNDRGVTKVFRISVGQPVFGYSQSSGGEVAPVIAPGSITHVEEVLSVKQPGKHLIAGIWSNLGDASRLMVQFHDSADVFDYHLSTESFTLLLSRENQAAIHVVPFLSARYDRAQRFVHADHGYVYSLGTSGIHGPKPWIVLVDADRNASVDQVLLMAKPLWESMGFADASKYENSL